MRILYIPFYSNGSNLKSEPSYTWATKLFGDWLRLEKKNILYWVIPKESLKTVDFNEVRDVSDRIKFIEVNVEDVQITELCNLPDELCEIFHSVRGKYVYDCLISEKPDIVPSFLARTWCWKKLRSFKTVVSCYHYMQDADVDSLVDNEIMQLSVGITSDFLLYSKYGLVRDGSRFWSGKITKHYSASNLQKLVSKPYIVRNYVNIPYVLEFRDKHKSIVKSDKFRVHYGVALNDAYKFPICCEIMYELGKYNPSSSMIITTPSKGGLMMKKYCKGDKFEISLSCSRDDFFKHALSSHVSLFITDQIGLNSASLLEMTLLGVLPLMKAGHLAFPWDVYYQDYPFVFSDVNEAVVLLRWLEKNYNSSKVKDALEKSQKIILQADRELCDSNKLIQFCREDHEKKLKSHKLVCDFSEFLKYVGDKFTLDDFVKAVRLKTGSTILFCEGKITKAHQFKNLFTVDAVRTMLMQLGYVDVGTSEEIIFEKRV